MSETLPIDRVPRTPPEREALLRERPEAWEFLLFGSWLYEKQQALEPRWEAAGTRQFPTVGQESSVVDDPVAAAQRVQAAGEAAHWMTGALRRVTEIVDQVSQTMTAERSEQAFGKPGEPGDANEIARFADDLLKPYRELLDWLDELDAQQPPATVQAVYRAAREFATQPLEQFRSYVADLVSNFDDFPAALREGRTVGGTFALTLTLDPAVSERFNREMEQSLAEVQHEADEIVKRAEDAQRESDEVTRRVEKMSATTNTKTPYTDYLIQQLGPTLWNFVTAHLNFLIVTTKASAAYDETTRVAKTARPGLFGPGRAVKDAQARAAALMREVEAVKAKWQQASAAFESTFQEGHAISAAATEEDVASAHASALHAEGNYRVTLSKTSQDGFAVAAIAILTGMRFSDAAEVVKSIQYVGAAELLNGLNLDQAVNLKKSLEPMEFAVSIAEGPPPGAYKRQAIPETVRHEVWKRDGGACVDCGSRDRLEFDHIVPVSKGGANTARNIELRCETCNRKKAAAI